MADTRLDRRPPIEPLAVLSLAFLVVVGCGAGFQAAKVSSPPRPRTPPRTRLPALHAAAVEGDFEAAMRLLDEGAPVDEKDPRGMTALHWAVGTGSADIERILLERGADVDAGDSCGFTPLHQAVITDDSDPVTRLLDAGAESDAVDCKGFTPLHHAAWRGCAATVSVLVKHGAIVDAFDKRRRTPLMLTVFAEDGLVAAQCLVEAGADVNLSEEGPSKVLTFAARAQQQAVGELLVQQGARGDLDRLLSYHRILALRLEHTTESWHSVIDVASEYLAKYPWAW